MTITQPDIRDKRQETRYKILKKTLFIECKKSERFSEKGAFMSNFFIKFAFGQ